MSNFLSALAAVDQVRDLIPDVQFQLDLGQTTVMLVMRVDRRGRRCEIQRVTTVDALRDDRGGMILPTMIEAMGMEMRGKLLEPYSIV